MSSDPRHYAARRRGVESVRSSGRAKQTTSIARLGARQLEPPPWAAVGVVPSRRTSEDGRAWGACDARRVRRLSEGNPCEHTAQMTAALRVMTFNVQLLPLIAGVLEGRVSVPAAALGRFPRGDLDSNERASLVANDLVSIPDAERPDVIALNEVFNEDGRQVLLDALTPIYPHCVASIQEKDLEEDAGLMVLSRRGPGRRPADRRLRPPRGPRDAPTSPASPSRARADPRAASRRPRYCGCRR